MEHVIVFILILVNAYANTVMLQLQLQRHFRA